MLGTNERVAVRRASLWCLHYANYWRIHAADQCHLCLIAAS